MRPVLRWMTLVLIGAVALLIGGVAALRESQSDDVSLYHWSYLLLTRTIAWFTILYVVAGVTVIVSRRRPRRPERSAPRPRLAGR